MAADRVDGPTWSASKRAGEACLDKLDGTGPVREAFRAEVITLDTSGLLALLDRREAHHALAVAVLEGDAGPYLVPAGILAEVAFMIERRLGLDVLELFLADLESGAFAFDCGEQDLPRIRQLVRAYADLPLGMADASVIACAERSGGRVLTFDVRDFGVVAPVAPITLLP